MADIKITTGSLVEPAAQESPILTGLKDERLVQDEQGGPRRDYAGAQKKTDPAEIRLVRKLDSGIMV